MPVMLQTGYKDLLVPAGKNLVGSDVVNKLKNEIK